ncbi:MAG: spore cortex-lytic protein [Ruminococcaceae bacterium]|nr:spore cortex-lytic protein [Oscillospiraceae bacterium]
MKGVITLPSTGYIQVHAYTSYAQIPLQDVTVAVSAPDGTAIALRLTDRSGRIEPIPIPVPDREESLSPNPPERPFATVNITARLKDYEQIFVDDVQVFSGVTTDQDLELIPLSELPETRTQSETFITSQQNL